MFKGRKAGWDRLDIIRIYGKAGKCKMSFWAEQGIFMVRIVVAAMCGAAIGFERKSRLKSAGIRTHMIVASTAALMIILSKYGFSDVLTSESVKLDPSRIASGIVSAVGFLGTGVIFVHRKEIVGLTTAAGIWATVGIGMAIGTGMYVVGIATTGFILLVQYALHRQIGHWRPMQEAHEVTACVQGKELQGVVDLLEARGIEVLHMTLKRSGENKVKAVLSVNYPLDFEKEDALKLVSEIPAIQTADI